MRTFTTTHVVYSFDELNKVAQDEAIEKLWDINVDHDWWDGDLEWFNSDYLADYGIEVDDMNFDLDRDAWIDFGGVNVVDCRKLLKAVGVDLQSKEARELVHGGIGVDKHYYAGGEFMSCFNLGHYYIDANSDKLDDIETKLNELWADLKADLLRKLRDEYDYCTSREAIVETIKANEYEFYGDGRIV